MTADITKLIIIGVNDSVLVNENEFRYKVHDEDIIILVLSVGHRREVYR